MQIFVFITFLKPHQKNCRWFSATLQHFSDFHAYCIIYIYIYMCMFNYVTRPAMEKAGPFHILRTYTPRIYFSWNIHTFVHISLFA